MYLMRADAPLRPRLQRNHLEPKVCLKAHMDVNAVWTNRKSLSVRG